MSVFKQSSHFGRSVAAAALVSAGLFALPAGAADLQTATSAPTRLIPAKQVASTATESKGETVEQRITNLHSSLKITPAEDASWNGVAQAMRENAAKMDGLVAANRTVPPQEKTAVADLKTYEQFAQAHVDGLKNLISSFQTLYDAMPDAQKKTADLVFQNSGREAAGGHPKQG